MTSRKEQGAATVQRVFGGALYQQGRGYYSALELFAILRGSVLLEHAQAEGGPVRVLPTPPQATQFLRPSHDFARRLLVGDLGHEGHPKLRGEATEATLRALLRGLECPVPGTRKPASSWKSRHFFPFPAEMAHYDAVMRGKGVSVERYIFRGGGGLAHKILRTDPVPERLARTRTALRGLMADSKSAVGRIGAALRRLDGVPAIPPEGVEPASHAFTDNVEGRSWSSGTAETRWFESLRAGFDRVLQRQGLTEFQRVEVLMHLVPFCLAMHQLAMARRRLELDEDGPLVLDAGDGPGPVRELARQHFSRASTQITDALLTEAEELGYADLLSGSANWRKGPRSFFATTLFAVGALNAHTGRRFLAVRPALLECLVAAFIDGQVPFAEFTRDVLQGRLGLVTDHGASQAAGDIDLDRADLDQNGEHLARRLRSLGLLIEYSDATRMVGLP